MYLQTAGLVFAPTGVIVYVINYVDLGRNHFARELDERYERFTHWGEFPDAFDYREPYRYRLRNKVVEAAPQDTEDYRFHHRRLLLMNRVHIELKGHRSIFASGGLPLQDRLLDMAYEECNHLDAGPLPLLTAMAKSWGTTVAGAAERVRVEHADRNDVLIQSETRRLEVLSDIKRATRNADLDILYVRYGYNE